MSHKSIILSVALFLCIGAATLLLTTSTIPRGSSNLSLLPRNAGEETSKSLVDGQWEFVTKDTLTNVSVASNGSRVSALNHIWFPVNYALDDVNIRVSFSNATFTAKNNSPQPIAQMNVLYLKVETNISEALSDVSVTLVYDSSEVMFTEKALWVFSYNAIDDKWTRLDDTIVYIDNDTVTFHFQMPATNLLELCLTGQETRGMEFPIWAWFFILVSFGIITFMAVGELVYQGYIPVAMRGTDGRVLVAFKRFFGAWGRKFTQLNAKVGGFIDYYENMSRTVPPIPPEKRPKAVSSLGHINRLGLQEEAEKLEEVYRPIVKPSQHLKIQKTEDKNPLAKAIFQESVPAKKQEEPGEKTFTPYIPATVRSRLSEKPQAKPLVKPGKEEKYERPPEEEKREKPAPETKQKPVPEVRLKPVPIVTSPSGTKIEEISLPPILSHEETKEIKETQTAGGKPKPAKKAAKKKAAKKIAKKTSKKPAVK